MEQEYTGYADNFFDDSVMAINGFEKIYFHSNKTFDIINTLLAIIETKMTMEENHARSLAKVYKNFSRHEHIDNKLVSAVVENIKEDAEMRLQLCKDIKINILNPIRETFNNQAEILKKAKSTVSFEIKTRKNLFENANKACRNFTQKNRLHEQTYKQPIEEVTDEKVKHKMYKSQETVRQAETEAQVCIQSLHRCLHSFEKIYRDYCSKIEATDHMLIDGACFGLENLFSITNKHLIDLQEMFKRTLAIPDEAKSDAYCANFLKNECQKNVFPTYVSIYCEDVNGKKEYRVHLSTTPTGDGESVQYFKGDMPRTASMTTSREIENDDDQSITQSVGDSMQRTCKSRIGCLAKSLYDFQPETSDELTLREGDIIKVIGVEDEHWYKGELNGNKGVFPSNYVTFDDVPDK
ncbi:SH3 domain-containing protein 21 [Thelohanellus kitauei]|uniref:SH3 domain-containing protein 21 n=1 Tax=Thelohanellus kitauei TaxID=669202 RepID=A0A0C2MPX3_THEKT|nr:SH3 domain-containing protein 21 [Thelohanellus kitauei]